MFTKNEYFITQMKLRELGKQRQALLTAYQELGREQVESATAADKLWQLYRGLRQVKFAGQSLHPDVANLEPVVAELEDNPANLETAAFWQARLDKELANGQLRAEIAFIFGALLEEWALQSSSINPASNRAETVRAELLANSLQPKPLGNYQGLLERLLPTNDPTRLSKVSTRLAAQLAARIDTSEVTNILTKISRDVHYASSLRRQAESFLANSIMLKELAEALSIWHEQLSDWQWPQEGVKVRAYWTPNKWRLFLEEELPTACLLEIIGLRFQHAFKTSASAARLSRISNLRSLMSRYQLRSDEVSFDEYDEEGNLVTYRNPGVVDIWAALDDDGEEDTWPEAVPKTEHGSIIDLRTRLKLQLRDLEELDGYGVKQSAGNMETALTLINAEIQLGRAAFPSTPLYVLKVDLKDFYPSLSHQLLLDILPRLGLNESQLDFVRRYLAVTVEDGEQVVTVQRGIPNDRKLADWLGEIVLNLLDDYITKTAPVEVIRLIDDICLITPSAKHVQAVWQAVQEFVKVCGLELNLEKCGAIAIGGTLPAGLPSEPPGWLMLKLQNDGTWSVNQAAFERYLEQARQQVEAAGSIIGQVEAYNASLTYLTKALGLRVALGENHRDSVGAALSQFQHSFFGAGRGMTSHLRQLISRRFADSNTSIQLPEAWLYWPITAGGLSLTQATIVANSFARSYYRRNVPTVPDKRRTDWQRRSNDWASYYQALLNEVTPVEPVPSQVMETLVSDFIQRGSELTRGRQTSLASYWRWVLYIYGPQILENLGTFRFLIRELVPLQLITEKYRATDSDEDSADEWDDTPF